MRSRWHWFRLALRDVDSTLRPLELPKRIPAQMAYSRMPECKLIEGFGVGKSLLTERRFFSKLGTCSAWKLVSSPAFAREAYSSLFRLDKAPAFCDSDSDH